MMELIDALETARRRRSRSACHANRASELELS